MTLEACYRELGGDYAEMCKRLPSAGLIEKFIVRFLEDQSFEALCGAMQSGSREEAFRAVHTLKGVCGNLSFTRLFGSASRLAEVLRPETDAIPDAAAALLEEVRRDYEATVAAIGRYQQEK